MCCQVEVSATGWSLVQSSPTDCGSSFCVILRPREWGGPVQLGAVAPKLIYLLTPWSSVLLKKLTGSAASQEKQISKYLRLQNLTCWFISCRRFVKTWLSTWSLRYHILQKLNTSNKICILLIHVFFFSFPVATQPIVYFTALYRALASSRTRLLDHIQRRATVGRTPLNASSVLRRDLYLKTHNTHNKHPCPGWDSNPRSQQASGRRNLDV